MWNCDKRSGILLLWSVHSSGLLKESALLVIHADTKTLHIFFQVIGFENILLMAVMRYSLAFSYDFLGVSIFSKCWIFHGVWAWWSDILWWWWGSDGVTTSTLFPLDYQHHLLFPFLCIVSNYFATFFPIFLQHYFQLLCNIISNYFAKLFPIILQHYFPLITNTTCSFHSWASFPIILQHCSMLLHRSEFICNNIIRTPSCGFN